jgi:YHS domain-containing protein
MKMTNVVVVSLCLFLLACGQRSTPRTRRSATTTDVQSVESVDPRPAVLDPPPVLSDEGPAPKPKINVKQQDAPPPSTPQDEALRAALPFAPAIAMDPIDGSKISIRVGTPTLEYKGRFYYFSSEANKRMFVANPQQYTKGVFSHF